MDGGPPHTIASLRVAAESGDRQAQFNLGRRFLRGQDVPKSQESAIYWLSRAAEQGHVVATIYLAELSGNRRRSAGKTEDSGFEGWIKDALSRLRKESKKPTNLPVPGKRSVKFDIPLLLATLACCVSIGSVIWLIYHARL